MSEAVSDEKHVLSLSPAWFNLLSGSDDQCDGQKRGIENFALEEIEHRSGEFTANIAIGKRKTFFKP